MRTHRWICNALMSALLPVVVCAAQEHEHQAHQPPKAKPGESMPYAQLTGDGRLHLVFVDDKDGVKRVKYRQLFGDAPVESAISAPDETLSHWPESPPKVFVTGDGTIHVLYTVRVSVQDGEGSPVDLRYVSSSDGGKTWSAPELVGDTGTPVYRSCAAMNEDSHGNLVLSWLEGHPGSAAVGLRTAVRREGVFHVTFLDQKACECCATELMTASDGSVWLGYRDVDEMNVRDLYLSRMTADGSAFGPPSRISRDKWVVNGCPDTGPRFALTPAAAVWTTWFSGNPRGVYAARATVDAPQFAARELVQGMDEHYTGLAHPSVGILPDGRVFVAYQCTRDGDQHIEGRVRTGNAWGEAIRLGDSGEYPRIVTNGKQAYLVYTAITKTAKSVAVHDLSGLVPASN